MRSFTSDKNAAVMCDTLKRDGLVRTTTIAAHVRIPGHGRIVAYCPTEEDAQRVADALTIYTTFRAVQTNNGDKK